MNSPARVKRANRSGWSGVGLLLSGGLIASGFAGPARDRAWLEEAESIRAEVEAIAREGERWAIDRDGAGELVATEPLRGLRFRTSELEFRAEAAAVRHAEALAEMQAELGEEWPDFLEVLATADARHMRAWLGVDAWGMEQVLTRLPDSWRTTWEPRQVARASRGDWHLVMGSSVWPAHVVRGVWSQGCWRELELGWVWGEFGADEEEPEAGRLARSIQGLEVVLAVDAWQNAWREWGAEEGRWRLLSALGPTLLAELSRQDAEAIARWLRGEPAWSFEAELARLELDALGRLDRAAAERDARLRARLTSARLAMSSAGERAQRRNRAELLAGVVSITAAFAITHWEAESGPEETRARRQVQILERQLGELAAGRDDLLGDVLGTVQGLLGDELERMGGRLDNATDARREALQDLSDMLVEGIRGGSIDAADWAQRAAQAGYILADGGRSARGRDGLPAVPGGGLAGARDDGTTGGVAVDGSAEDAAGQYRIVRQGPGVLLADVVLGRMELLNYPDGYAYDIVTLLSNPDGGPARAAHDACYMFGMSRDQAREFIVAGAAVASDEALRYISWRRQPVRAGMTLRMGHEFVPYAQRPRMPPAGYTAWTLRNF